MQSVCVPLKRRGSGCHRFNFCLSPSKFDVQVAFLLPTIQKLEGPGGLYLGFAGMAALAWIVIYLVVVETKMKTLEEIEAIMIGSKRNGRAPSMKRMQINGADSNVQLAKQGFVNL